MVLKLYGFPSPLATTTRRVAFVLAEKRVPFEFVPIDLSKGEHKAPEYVAKHPFGQVPLIENGDFTLYESRAIAWYIAAKYADQGTPLIPKGVEAQALMMQGWSVETSNFTSAPYALYEVLFKPLTGGTTDPAIVKQRLDETEKTLDVLNKILEKQAYMGGEEFSIVDIFYFPYIEMLPPIAEGRPHIINSRPALKRWFDAVVSRPAWQAVKDGVKTTLQWD